MTRLDRRLLFTTGAAAALLAATGVSAQLSPKRGGRLVAALSGADRSDTWAQPNGLFMQAACGSVFENLTEIAADGTLRGDIAKAWTTHDGGLTWVFEAHDNVVFHDGIELRMEDVASMFLRHTELNVEAAEAIGKRSLQITLAGASPSLPYLLADPQFGVLPCDHARQGLGIGTGLYHVQKFQAGRHFIGSRVATHRKDGAAGWFDSVELVSIPSETVRAEALRDTLVDVADITALDAYTDPTEFQYLPSDHAAQQIARKSVAVPATVGTAWPLDNLRMSQRWWRA
jgi:ABC-type transport system substrate-binding protein